MNKNLTEREKKIRNLLIEMYRADVFFSDSSKLDDILDKIEDLSRVKTINKLLFWREKDKDIHVKNIDTIEKDGYLDVDIDAVLEIILEAEKEA